MPLDLEELGESYREVEGSIKLTAFAYANKLPENQGDCTVYCDPVVAMEEEQVLAGEIRTLSPQDISLEQDKDAVLRRVKELIRSGVSKYGRNLGKTLVEEPEKIIFFENKTLYRLTHLENQKPLRQLCIPDVLRDTIYKELRTNMGHLGDERVCTLARDRFYWPQMSKNITHFLRNVCICLKGKRPTLNITLALQPIKSSHPFELVSMDYVHLERSKGEYEYI